MFDQAVGHEGGGHEIAGAPAPPAPGRSCGPPPRSAARGGGGPGRLPRRRSRCCTASTPLALETISQWKCSRSSRASSRGPQWSGDRSPKPGGPHLGAGLGEQPAVPGPAAAPPGSPRSAGPPGVRWSRWCRGRWRRRWHRWLVGLGTGASLGCRDLSPAASTIAEARCRRLSASSWRPCAVSCAIARGSPPGPPGCSPAAAPPPPGSGGAPRRADRRRSPGGRRPRRPPGPRGAARSAPGSTSPGELRGDDVSPPGPAPGLGQHVRLQQQVGPVQPGREGQAAAQGRARACR